MYRNEGPVMCGGPGYDFYVLGERIRSCAAKVEASTDRIRLVQSIDWQSPAGEAFRQCLYEDLRNVMNLRDEVINAAAAVGRLAHLAALEDSARTAGASG
jgi:hypothetical protein